MKRATKELIWRYELRGIHDFYETEWGRLKKIDMIDGKWYYGGKLELHDLNVEHLIQKNLPRRFFTDKAWAATLLFGWHG